MSEAAGTPLDVRYRAYGRGEYRGRPWAPAGDGGGGGPGAGFAPPPPAPALQVPPWFLVKPPEAADFTACGRVAGLTSAAGQTVLTGSTVQIPANNVPVIRSLTLEVNNLLSTSDIDWRLRVNGNPVEGWAPLTVFPRSAATITVAYGPEETFIILPEGALIDVTAQVHDAGTYDVGAHLHGWFVGADVAERHAALLGAV